MKPALALITYCRPDYLAQVVASILSQRIGGLRVSERYDIHVFQDGLSPGESPDNQAGHAKTAAMIEGLAPERRTFRQGSNLGVALHFDFIEKLLFVEKDYDFVLFCEDDLILAPGYLAAIEQMRERFADDARVGMMAAHPANCTAALETQRAHCRRYAPMGHNWGFGLSRAFWQRRQPFVECYLDLIRDVPYRQRDEAKVFKWLELCGFKGAASSQDYVKSCATWALGACKLSTFANFGLPIGRRGLHCNPKLFSLMGFSNTVVYDDDVRIGDLDEEQFEQLYLSSGHQVGAASVTPGAAAGSFDSTAWLRRLNAGELHPSRLLSAAPQPGPESAAKAWRESDISQIPHMDPEGLALFDARLQGARVYLEYGAGGSTVMAAQRGVEEIHSVESDLGFLSAVEQRLRKCGTAARFHPLYVDIGPTKEWGWPADASCAAQWPGYASAPLATPGAPASHADLILIDGRFRVACFLTSLLQAQPGTVVLFDDYVCRPQYHGVERHVPPRALAGRMAEFVVPADIDRGAVSADLQRFAAIPD